MLKKLMTKIKNCSTIQKENTLEKPLGVELGSFEDCVVVDIEELYRRVEDLEKQVKQLKENS